MEASKIRVGTLTSWFDSVSVLKTALLVASIAFLVHANSIGNGFVTDDPSVILKNPLLQGSPLSLFKAIDTISDTQLLPFYRPLTYITFFLEGRLHGFDPALMHLLNVLLHAVNAALVFLLARTVLGGQVPALIAGLLFAVHPVNTESVNFLAGGRNTMLAAAFALLALLVQGRSIRKDSFALALVSAALLLGGMLSKESALMALPFVVANEIAVWRRSGQGLILPTMLRLAPYAGAAAAYVGLRWLTLSELGIQTSIVPGLGMHRLSELYVVPTFAERMLSNLYIIPKYLLTVFWPVALSPRYAVPDDLHLMALPLAVGWMLILSGLLWLLKGGRSAASILGVIWFVVFLFPVSGVFPVSSILLADRYLYLPAIGLWVIAADQVTRIKPAGNTATKYVLLGCALLCAVLAGLTMKRNLEWRSEVRLFSRMVEQYPENPHGYFHLGIAYLIRKEPGDLSRAEKNFQMLLALDPDTQSAQTPLGTIRLESGDPAMAVSYYSEAIGNDPLDSEARINRAIALEQLGRTDDALFDYRFYLANPGRSPVPGSLGYAESRIRQLSSQ